MNKKVTDALIQKILDGISGGFAFCELLIDKAGKAIDYRFLMVNSVFEKQSNRDIESTVGKTIKEILPDVKQAWIDKLGAVVLENKPANFTYFNLKTKRYYHVNAFSQTKNKFVMVVDDITTKKNALKELNFQNKEKEKRAAELVIANKELVFQSNEKEKRAAELVIAEKELAFQSEEKEKRAKELIIANIELAFQNSEKEKRAVELANFIKKGKESDWLKSAFLANMCHETRIPMDGILGFPELLQSLNLSSEQQQDYIRIIENFGNNMRIELDSLTSLFNPSFIKFEEVIQHNTYSNISVNELAFLCNMSLSSFKRKFAKIYTISPNKYLMKLKLKKASELLKNKSNLISNIASEVGFESLTTFNRSFKSYYGKSPSKYRMDQID